MRKKIICMIISLLFLLGSFTTFADTVNASFSATQCVSGFYTSSSIAKSSSYTWDLPLLVNVSSICSSGTTSVKIRPVNQNKVVMGDFYTWNEAGVKNIPLTNTTYNHIRLYVKNNNGGTNIQISGLWIGSYV